MYRNIVLLLATAYIVAMAVVWQQTLKVSERGLDHINGLFTREFQRMLTENQRLLSGLSHELLVPGNGRAPENSQEVLNKLVDLMPGNLGIGLAQPDGRVVLDSAQAVDRTLPNLVTDIQFSESFQDAVKSGEPRIGPPHYFAPVDSWVVPIFKPLFDDSGQLNSVFIGRFPAGASGKNWSNMSLPMGLKVTMMREDGTPIFHQPLPADFDQTTIESIFGRPVSARQWWSADAAPDGMVVQTVFGEDQYLVHVYLDTLKLHGFASVARSTLIKAWLLQMLIPTFLLFLCVLSGRIAYRYAERRREGLLNEINRLSAWQEAALDSADYTIISTDTEGVIATFNQAAQRLLGYTGDEVIGKCTPEIIHDADELVEYARILSEELGEEIESDFGVLVEKARRGQIDEREWHYVRKDGSKMPVFLSVTAMRGENSEIIGYLGVACDLSETKAVQTDLAETETRYQTLFDEAGDAILLVQENGRIIECNPATERLFGCPVNKIIDKTILHFSPAMQPEGISSRDKAVQKTEATIGGNRQIFEWQLKTVQGRILDAEISVSMVEIGKVQHMQATLRDVTQRKHFEDQLAYQAGHDSLTGLPNRKSLHEAFPQYQQSVDESGGCVAMLLLDLDRFKVINDTLGHQLGDQVIREVGPRLQEVCGDSDAMIVRLGGDEFTVLLRTDKSTDEICKMATTMLDGLLDPFEVGGIQTSIGASIGIACYPLHGKDSHEVLRAADVAMYEAKSHSLGVKLYEKKIDEYSKQRLSFGADLPQAVKQGQLVLHYQPKINIGSGAVEGFEALVRWEHPQLGLLYPDSFLDLIEMSEVIHPFTHAVIELAVREKKYLHSLGYRQPVAINLSPRNLLDDNCFHILEAALASQNLSTREVELELTESSVMHDPERAITVLEKFNSRGVNIAVDDFGTGYSSLAYLRRLPVNALKIDRAFVMHLLSSTQDSAIVRSTIALAHSLEMKVIAEGVEDTKTLQLLRSMDCDEAQGYGICRPIPLADLVKWLTRKNPAANDDGSPVLREVSTS